jgi:hypothetical protein
MSKGPLAIFGHWTTGSKNSIETYSNFYNVPFLSWSPSIYKHESNEENLEKEAFVEQANVDNPDGDFSNENNYMKSSQANLHHVQDHFVSDSVEKPSFQVNFHPDLVPLLISLIKYNRWKTIYYIYNHEEG